MRQPIEIYPAGEQKPVNRLSKVLGWVLYFGILAVAYWFYLPPFHYQSMEFWGFLLFALVLRLIMSGFSVIKSAVKEGNHWDKEKVKDTAKSLGFLAKIFGIAALAVVLFLIIGSVLGWQLFRANRYGDLLVTQNGDFATDVAELSAESIPVVDKEVAVQLGQRKLGGISDLVSQFEVDESYYTQINYKGSPYRVTPLQYGDFFKWMGNRKQGVPSYITVNMVTQDTQLVRIEGMKYSNSEYFFRYLPRHLRLQYPTKMFDNISFELDDNGTPYYVASTYRYTIGLFGGKEVNGAVLCNAITGECTYYAKEQVPTWVDQLYSADMVLEQLTYNGKYQSGYWNSLFGQKGVLQPTEGYNYIAMNDDVYLYTGITSAAGDESNVGFVLVNMRTKETSYYSCPGAEEYSAMGSAQGMVQDLGYSSTFPLLLNVADRPTYFVSLKDSEGLVKMYAYVDMQQYQVVGTGTTLQEARDAYAKKLKDEAKIDIEAPKEDAPPPKVTTVSGVVESIAPVVVEGNTHYYVKLQQNDRVYSVNITVNEKVPFVKAGDTVSLTVTGEIPQSGAVAVTAFALEQPIPQE